MNNVAAGEIIACAGFSITRECARVIEEFGHNDQRNKYQFVMTNWLSADQLRGAILTWVVDRSSPWDSIHLALSHRIPLLVPEANAALTEFCVNANCGIWYRGEADARLCLEYLLSSDTIRERLGANGQTYLAASNTFVRLQHNLAARTSTHSGA